MRRRLRLSFSVSADCSECTSRPTHDIHAITPILGPPRRWHLSSRSLSRSSSGPPPSPRFAQQPLNLAWRLPLLSDPRPPPAAPSPFSPFRCGHWSCSWCPRHGLGTVMKHQYAGSSGDEATRCPTTERVTCTYPTCNSCGQATTTRPPATSVPIWEFGGPSTHGHELAQHSNAAPLLTAACRRPA